MTNTQKFAKQELEILEKTVPNAIAIPFKDEILALCEAFGKSGQSGGSAPMTATILSKTIKNLLLQEPVCEITDADVEWNELDYDDEVKYQSKRCSALFKNKNNKAYYLYAVVWKGVEDWDTFTGGVYVDDKNFEFIRSRQYVRFPFKPKTFYIDVVRVPVSKKDAEEKKLHFIEDRNNECYYSILKNPKQLESVFKYYDKYI